MRSEYSALLFPADKYTRNEVEAIYKAFGSSSLRNMPNGVSYLIIDEFKDAINLRKFNLDEYYVAFFYVVISQ